MVRGSTSTAATPAATRRYAAAAAVGWTLIVLAVGGCSGGSSGSPGNPNVIACVSTDNCPPGFVCFGTICAPADAPCGGCPAGKACDAAARVCRTRCTADTNCARPGQCDTSTGTCRGEPSGTCTPSCDAGLVCVAGTCAPDACRADTDCEAGAACSAAVGAAPRTCTPKSCAADAACGAGARCDTQAALCRSLCTGDGDCRDGRVCVRGACAPPPAECAVDYDCAGRRICDALKQCSVGPACARDDTCGAGRRCLPETGRCTYAGCADNRDCTAGQVCNPTTRACEAERVADGGPCVDTPQCNGGSLCNDGTCRKACDPAIVPERNGCPAGFGCALIRSGGDSGRGRCLPSGDGKIEGVICNLDAECRSDLFCVEGFCAAPCDLGGRPDGRTCRNASRNTCQASSFAGVGLCKPKPCDPVSNPCPAGRRCVTTGTRAGKCDECTRDADCLADYYCDEAFTCKAGCRIEGCDDVDNSFCNRDTNRCTVVCTPACAGDETCVNGRCVPQPCDPPCQAPCSCARGRCECPPDCRRPESPCVAPLECDASSGVCRPPQCPSCAADECCDAATAYRCGPCNLCAPANPTGVCPTGRVCRDGGCRDIPPAAENRPCGALSVPRGAPCASGLTCCEPTGFEGAGGYCCVVCNADGTCGEAPP